MSARIAGITLLVLIHALATGCSRPSKPGSDEVLARLRGGEGQACPAPPVEVFLQADTAINPNEHGQPMPVEVRILLLRDRARFDQLDFEHVWRQAEEALGPDLASSATVTVFPGEVKIHTLKAATDVAYVALVAIFRQVRDREWQHVVDIRQNNKRCADEQEALHTIVQATVQGNSITRPSEAIAP